MKLNLAIFTAAISLCKPIHILAGCQEYYANSNNAAATGRDPSNPVPLECEPFEGSPTLHAIVFGCNTIEQEVAESDFPERIIARKSFTQFCQAQVGEFTIFTCYDHSLEAENTDFGDFEAEAEAGSFGSCEEGDTHDFPIFMYQITTAEYVNGVGGQKTVGNATATFDPFYARTFPIYVKKVVDDGSALTYVPTAAPPAATTPVPTNVTGIEGNANATTPPGGDGSVDIEGNGEGADSSAHMFFTQQHLKMAGVFSIALAFFF